MKLYQFLARLETVIFVISEIPEVRSKFILRLNTEELNFIFKPKLSFSGKS